MYMYIHIYIYIYVCVCAHAHTSWPHVHMLPEIPSPKPTRRMPADSCWLPSSRSFSAIGWGDRTWVSVRICFRNTKEYKNEPYRAIHDLE